MNNRSVRLSVGGTVWPDAKHLVVEVDGGGQRAGKIGVKAELRWAISEAANWAHVPLCP
jgi:hypothetical protein